MRLADLSVEYAHLYLRQVTEETALDAAETAQRWVGPIVERYTSSGLTVSKTIMVDDYFTADAAVIEDRTQMIVDTCTRVGWNPDYVVYESACASTVERMLERVVPELRAGDGSTRGAARALRDEWLSNGQSGRAAPVEPDEDSLLSTGPRRAASADASMRAVRDGSTSNHSIHLDVELFRATRGQRLYACPTLAAWWQLIRLGMLRDDEGAIAIPDGTVVADGAPVFAAKRTVTVLSPRFIEVEHAVRTILGQVVAPPEWLSPLRLARDEPRPDEPLRRIAYVFVPEGFDPPRMSSS